MCFPHFFLRTKEWMMEWWGTVKPNKESFEKRFGRYFGPYPKNTFYGYFSIRSSISFSKLKWIYPCWVSFYLLILFINLFWFAWREKQRKTSKNGVNTICKWRRKNGKRLKLFTFTNTEYMRTRSFLFKSIQLSCKLTPRRKNIIHTVELPLCHSLKTILGVDLTSIRLLKWFPLVLLSLNLFPTKAMHINT